MKLIHGLFHADFFLASPIYHEDVSDVFLRNVGWISPDYTALYPIAVAVNT
jgi:hypothetical protein